MDPNQQGGDGDPNGGGAYYNYNPTQQRQDHPSSSSQAQGWRPRLQPATPLQIMTSWSALQPLGGYSKPLNQSSWSGGIIPTGGNGNIQGYDLTPWAAAMPGHPVYHNSVSAASSRPSMSNLIANGNGNPYQYQPNQPRPGSSTVFSAPSTAVNAQALQPGSSNVFSAPSTAVYAQAQQPGSSTTFSAPSTVVHAQAQQPGSANVFDAPGYTSNLIPHASFPWAPVYNQPGATTGFFARDDGNANNYLNASAGVIAPPPANANQLGARFGPVAHPSVQNTLASSLLADISRAKNNPGDLEGIVNTVVANQHNGVRLMEIASVARGERALQNLVRLVVRKLGPQALRRLFWCLIEGWIMEQSNGPDLLRLFFTTLDYGAHFSAIFINEVAAPRFWDMITSRTGSMSIMGCLESAGYTAQGVTLQNAIVTHTVEIARTESGSSFLRAVLQVRRYGYDQFEERIRKRVVDSLVELCMHPYGNDVVRACFVPNPRLPWIPLLEHGLHEFSLLPDEQLRNLVPNLWASRVLSHLLLTSVKRNVAKERAMSLADRILGVGAAGDETDDVALHRSAGDRRQQALALIGRSNLPR